MMPALRRCVLFAALIVTLVAADESPTIQSARALYEDGQLAAAEREFRQGLARAADAAEAHFWLGEIALRRNDPDTAISWLEKSVALAPSVSRYHHRLGDAYGRAAQNASIFSALGFARKCLAALRQAVAVDPTNLDARYSLLLFYAGAPRIIGGGADKAAAEARAIQAVDPDRGRLAMATLQVSQRNLEAARAELAQIQRNNLTSLRSDRALLSDVAWISAKVGWGEPAGNHLWFDDSGRATIALIVHGRLYAKGLYAPPPSRYTFALAGEWKVFTATVGLQDGSNIESAAVFVVRGDGRELFRSAPLGVDASQQVKIDVAGVKELELLTELKGGEARFSRAIWADATVRR